MAEHYDALETRDPAARETAQFAALRDLIADAKAKAPAWSASLEGVAADDVENRAALARLPVLRKSDLLGLQDEAPPFGGYATLEPGAAARVFMSPGPIWEPQGRRPDAWRFARAQYAAGLRAGMVLHNAFAYHMTPAGHMVESGAEIIGAAVFPAGVGNTELQVQAIARLKPTAYAGTPDFLQTLFDKADEMGLDASSIRCGLVGGAAFTPAMRQGFKARGAEIFQCYATADCGLIAYESDPVEGMIVDEGVIVEIVEPNGTAPLPEGEVGELVVSVLNPDYPLFRFATGDLSAVLPGVSRCGRTNMRIRGWMGRADQTAKIKGMFVHPAQIAEIARRHPEIARARLVITRTGGRDLMTLHCETTSNDDGLAAAIAKTVTAVCKLRGEVALAAPGSLPEDGKLISDDRVYD